LRTHLTGTNYTNEEKVMKLVKNFVLAVLLASTFAVNTLAGETQVPGVVNPPPPPASSRTDETKNTIYSYSDPDATDVTAETSDYLFFEALAALLSVY
jgi:hypothetical protein